MLLNVIKEILITKKISRHILKCHSELKWRFNWKLHLLPTCSNFLYFFGELVQKRIVDSTLVALNQLEISKSHCKPIKLTILDNAEYFSYIPPLKRFYSTKFLLSCVK